jgi:hypothetical protein
MKPYPIQNSDDDKTILTTLRKGFLCFFSTALFCTVFTLCRGEFSPLDHVKVVIADDLKSPSNSLNISPYKEDEGVIFLKTHKTASSTMTSIFWRNLCLKRKRNCFLPPIETPGRTWDLSKSVDWKAISSNGASTLPSQPSLKASSSSSILRGAWGNNNNNPFPFNTWIFHVHYNKELLNQVITKTNRMISIVRKPSLRFQSAWYWYNHSKKFHDITLNEFIEKNNNPYRSELAKNNIDANAIAGPSFLKRFYNIFKEIFSELIAKSMIGSGSLSDKFKYRQGLDSMSQELTGVNMHNDGAAKGMYIDLLDRIKSGSLILLVADRFDESLLVLGYFMNWSLYDLVYIKLKVRVRPGEGESNSESESDSLPKKNESSSNMLDTLDYMQEFDYGLWKLANYYLDKYIKEIFQDGNGNGKNRFQEKLLEFQKLNAKVTHECSKYTDLGIGVGIGIGEQMKVSHLKQCETLLRDNKQAVSYARSLKNKEE